MVSYTGKWLDMKFGSLGCTNEACITFVYVMMILALKCVTRPGARRSIRQQIAFLVSGEDLTVALKSSCFPDLKLRFPPDTPERNTNPFETLLDRRFSSH